MPAIDYAYIKKKCAVVESCFMLISSALQRQNLASYLKQVKYYTSGGPKFGQLVASSFWVYNHAPDVHEFWLGLCC